MKPANTLAALLIALMLALSGCGTSDYVQSVQLTATTPATGGGLFNIAGWGGTLQLQANAIYHSGKTVPVTNNVKYLVTAQGNDAFGTPLAAPPNTVTTNTTGMMTAVDPPVCTWEDLSPPPAAAPSWFLTGSYQVIADYNGMQSQPIFVGIASSAGADPNGACGP